MVGSGLSTNVPRTNCTAIQVFPTAVWPSITSFFECTFLLPELAMARGDEWAGGAARQPLRAAALPERLCRAALPGPACTPGPARSRGAGVGPRALPPSRAHAPCAMRSSSRGREAHRRRRPLSPPAATRPATAGPVPPKNRLTCMACGGRHCKRCGVTAYLAQDGGNAVPGLHSSWIGFGSSIGSQAAAAGAAAAPGAAAAVAQLPALPSAAGAHASPLARIGKRRRPWSVLATQRPSERSLRDFHIVPWMRAQDPPITAVFNLQEPGEHPWCGDGILPATGFSYDPETLERGGVEHVAAGWADFGVPDLDTMATIVRRMARHEDAGGRVAVHCHAGLGRTGLVIACFLVQRYRLTPHEAVAEVRADRPGSVQTAKQAAFVARYAARVTACRRVFLLPLPGQPQRRRVPGGEAAPGLSDVLAAQSFLVGGRGDAAPLLVERAARALVVLLEAARIASGRPGDLSPLAGAQIPRTGRAAPPPAGSAMVAPAGPRGLLAEALAACAAPGGSALAEDLAALVNGVNDGHWSLLGVDESWCSAATAAQQARLVGAAALRFRLLLEWLAGLAEPVVRPHELDVGLRAEGAGGAAAPAAIAAPGAAAAAAAAEPARSSADDDDRPRPGPQRSPRSGQRGSGRLLTGGDLAGSNATPPLQTAAAAPARRGTGDWLQRCMRSGHEAAARRSLVRCLLPVVACMQCGSSVPVAPVKLLASALTGQTSIAHSAACQWLLAASTHSELPEWTADAALEAASAAAAPALGRASLDASLDLLALPLEKTASPASATPGLEESGVSPGQSADAWAVVAAVLSRA